jgi:proteasome assembly chaperone (PAC2) family protein
VEFDAARTAVDAKEFDRRAVVTVEGYEVGDIVTEDDVLGVVSAIRSTDVTPKPRGNVANLAA